MTADRPNKPNTRLRRHRQQHGWSLQKAADLIHTICDEDEAGSGITGNLVGRWERGEIAPSPFYRDKLCRLYDCTAETLGLIEEETTTISPSSSSISPDIMEQGSHQAGLTTVPTGLESDETVKRRDFLREAGQRAIAGTFFLTSHEIFNDELLVRFQRALEKPSTLDEKMLAYLEHRTGAYWQDRHGGTLSSYNLLEFVTDHFRKITSLLENPLQPTFRKHLCSIASETAQLSGHLLFDMGQYPEARRCHKAAIVAAQEAGNVALQITAWARMSFTWTYGNNVLEALMCIHTARQLATGGITGGVQAYLSAVEAEIQAIIGDRVACLDALNRAEYIEDKQISQEDSCKGSLHFSLIWQMF